MRRMGPTGYKSVSISNDAKAALPDTKAVLHVLELSHAVEALYNLNFFDESNHVSTGKGLRAGNKRKNSQGSSRERAR